MAIEIPRYIRESTVQSPIVRYKWDDWNVEAAEEPVDEDFYKRLQELSQRANMAFAFGTAEWIIYRFWPVCDDPLPLIYLEAAWAKAVHESYGEVTWEEYINEEQWIGPIRGAIGTAMESIQYTLQQAEEDGDVESGGAWLTNLAQYVMNDPQPYQRWRDLIIDRLGSAYSRSPNETLGEVVPREALDPGSDFDVGRTESLVNRFLAGLDYRFNPFLNSPEAMRQTGFVGTPYVFDIEVDRKARFEW